MAWLPRLSFPGASAVPPASHSRQINYSSRIAARYWRSLFWYRESPLMATSRHSVAQNRLPLCPQQRTFRGPRWTSGYDPQATFMDRARRILGTEKSDLLRSLILYGSDAEHFDRSVNTFQRQLTGRLGGEVILDRRKCTGTE